MRFNVFKTSCQKSQSVHDLRRVAVISTIGQTPNGTGPLFLELCSENGCRRAGRRTNGSLRISEWAEPLAVVFVCLSSRADASSVWPPGSDKYNYR